MSTHPPQVLLWHYSSTQLLCLYQLYSHALHSFISYSLHIIPYLHHIPHLLHIHKLHFICLQLQFFHHPLIYWINIMNCIIFVRNCSFSVIPIAYFDHVTSPHSSAVGCEVLEGGGCMELCRCARFTSARVVTLASSSSFQRWWLLRAWATSSGMSMNAGNIILL